MPLLAIARRMLYGYILGCYAIAAIVLLEIALYGWVYT